MSDYAGNHIRWEHWCYGILTDCREFITLATGGEYTLRCNSCGKEYQLVIRLTPEEESEQ